MERARARTRAAKKINKRNVRTHPRSYCGMADGELALVQHRTRLFLVNVPVMSGELFRQLALQRFGRLRPLAVAPQAPLAPLLELALEEEAAAGRWDAGQGSLQARRPAGWERDVRGVGVRC